MAQLCLEQLVSNKKSAPLILINDSIQMSALPLCREFSHRALESGQHVITLLTETSPTDWLQSIAGTSPNTNKVHIIDAYSDPYGWEYDTPLVHEKDTNGCGSLVRLTQLDDFERHILPLIMEWTKKAPSCLIVVDALTPLAHLSTHRAYQLVKALESLTTGKDQRNWFLYIVIITTGWRFLY